MGARSAGGRGARGRASGRAGVGGSDARARAERAWVSGTVAVTRPCWPATRPALAGIRPGQGPRYGHCVHLGMPVRA